jgi:hypothetical protein
MSAASLLDTIEEGHVIDADGFEHLLVERRLREGRGREVHGLIGVEIGPAIRERERCMVVKTFFAGII